MLYEVITLFHLRRLLAFARAVGGQLRLEVTHQVACEDAGFVFRIRTAFGVAAVALSFVHGFAGLSKGGIEVLLGGNERQAGIVSSDSYNFV